MYESYFYNSGHSMNLDLACKLGFISHYYFVVIMLMVLVKNQQNIQRIFSKCCNMNFPMSDMVHNSPFKYLLPHILINMHHKK